MDIIPPKHDNQAIGDADLARVLAGVDGINSQTSNTAKAANLEFEATKSQADLIASGQAVAKSGIVTPLDVAEPLITSLDKPKATPMADGLETIKKSALEELRPLVGKLDLPPEEKFDTLLLIIRSTDDRSLLQTAYDTAKTILDETKRAQALLDVIKEIDYFSAAQII